MTFFLNLGDGSNAKINTLFWELSPDWKLWEKRKITVLRQLERVAPVFQGKAYHWPSYERFKIVARHTITIFKTEFIWSNQVSCNPEHSTCSFVYNHSGWHPCLCVTGHLGFLLITPSTFLSYCINPIYSSV